MGGMGSRSYSTAGRKQKRTVEVVGTGKPIVPKGVPDDVKKAFASLVKLTVGITFSQDSRVILEAAELIVRQDAFLVALRADPINEKLNRMSLALGRRLDLLLSKLGLDPRSRQSMLAPAEKEPEDRLTAMLAARAKREGVPSRRRDLAEQSKSRFFK